MSEDDTSDTEEALEAAGEGLKTASEVAKTAGHIADGDAAGAVGAGLGAAGGAAGLAADAAGGSSEATQALQTAGAAANAAGSLIDAGNRLAQGDVAGGAGGLGSAASSSQYLVPDNEVSSVLGTAGQLAGTAQQLGNAVSEMTGGGGGGHDDLDAHVEVTGFDGLWQVQSFAINEAVNTIPIATISALYDGHLEVTELLQVNCSLSLERRRSEQVRYFKGIILHATVREVSAGVEVSLKVSPAAALLGHRFDSRIHQDETVVETIQAVFDDMMGPLQRTIRVDDLTRDYATREYLVQHQETQLHFIRRLCEEEGIFFFFEYEDEHEVMVLADSTGSLAQAREQDDGSVPYHASEAARVSGYEYATDLHHSQQVGPTDAVIGDYDWTHPTLSVRGEQTGRGSHEPALEVYDHTSAQLFHSYSGGQYGANTAQIQAQLHAERLDLDRQTWEMTTNVVTSTPGRTLAIEGHPNADLDQRYIILSSSCHGAPGSQGGRGAFSAHHRVAPSSMPYRPPRTTIPPVIHGPQLATVVGPDGAEIHTDEHGRVRVHFPWDRYHETEAENSSCWIRVSQSWAGPGSGTFFLPRIGMEVLVSFIDGSPDRPLVTGCVYNGSNRAGVELDAKKTQSLIRTKSSPNSDGYNEIRFEDEAGSEFISTHAQKDYNEVVEHCHSTHVKVDQSNTVDHDQTETVGNDQTLEVKGERMKTVHKPETTYVFDDRTETVHGVETLDLRKTRQTTITEDEVLEIQRDRQKLVKGAENQRIEGERTVVVTADDTLSVRSGGNRVTHITEGEYRISVKGKYLLVQNGTEKVILDSDQVYIESSKHVHVHANNTDLNMNSNGEVSITAAQKILLDGGGTKLELSSSGAALEGPEIQAQAGESMLKLAASGATLKGSNVDILADMFATVKAILARIN